MLAYSKRLKTPVRSVASLNGPNRFCWMPRSSAPFAEYSLTTPPVVLATTTGAPPDVMVAASCPGPMNGSVSWIAPLSLIGQPGSRPPVAPLTAYIRDEPPSCESASANAPLMPPLRSLGEGGTAE